MDQEADLDLAQELDDLFADVDFNETAPTAEESDSKSVERKGHELNTQGRRNLDDEDVHRPDGQEHGEGSDNEDKGKHAVDNRSDMEEDEDSQGEETASEDTEDRPSARPQPKDAEAERRLLIMQAMTDAQLNRSESWRRSSLARPKMKKLVTALLGMTNVNDKLVIAMCGITKLYVGELVETARILAEQEGYKGPLLPSHIHRAYQVLHSCGRIMHPKHPLRKTFPHRKL